MADPELPPERFSLRRWSERKLAAARNDSAAAAVAGHARPQDDAGLPVADAGLPVAASAEAATPAAVAAPETVPAPTPELPPVESLTFNSDFTAFLRAGVDETTKRGALKKLFADPRFNVMDGLDTYIDDYSLPDPLDPAIARQLVSARYIFDPPQTRVNDQGVVEDVPAQAAAGATLLSGEADLASGDAKEAPALGAATDHGGEDSLVGSDADSVVASIPAASTEPEPTTLDGARSRTNSDPPPSPE